MITGSRIRGISARIRSKASRQEPGDPEAASSNKEPDNAATSRTGKYRDFDGRGPKPCKFGWRIRSGSLPDGGNNTTNRRLI